VCCKHAPKVKNQPGGSPNVRDVYGRDCSGETYRVDPFEPAGVVGKWENWVPQSRPQDPLHERSPQGISQGTWVIEEMEGEPHFLATHLLRLEARKWGGAAAGRWGTASKRHHTASRQR